MRIKCGGKEFSLSQIGLCYVSIKSLEELYGFDPVLIMATMQTYLAFVQEAGFELEPLPENVLKAMREALVEGDANDV